MKQISMLTALLMAAGLAGCGGDVATNSDFTAVNPAEPVSDWQLVWSDEFDGTSIDRNKWTHEVNCAGGGNQEKQCYTDSPDNAFVADGKLHIVALPAGEGSPLPYTSARLNTKYQGDFKYGRIEMRAKLPSGQGAWPAFWMLPTDEVYGGWPKSGEIDIMEAVNLKVVAEDGVAEANVHGTLHYGRDWPNNVYSGKAYLLPEGMNPADGFHTYAIEWQEGEIRWYVDDYLYQTQMASKVRFNSRGEAVGLSHRGWFAEYYNIATGALETQWNNAPFDQRFHILLNLAVGGNWPENVNNLGIDAEAFADGQTFEIDYVRVYQCGQNLSSGKGCETVRAGYKDADTLVIGEAPIPSPPSTGVAQNLTIFAGTPNPNWPAWDCCGGSTPALVADAERGDVYEFLVGPQPTVNGFISRSAFVTAPGVASPFDASPLIATGSVSFDMQVVSAPSNPDSSWIFKVESNNNSSFAELAITASSEGMAPVTGQWQSYSFPLQMLADAGLDLSAIDVVMIFPAWDTGNGAVYRVDNVQIAAPATASPELVIFTDGQNPAWPMWDCCGGSTPIEVMDDEAHGLTAEFSIGAAPTVMGFINRAPAGSGEPFDASALLAEGVVQFELKVVDAPANPDSSWLFKIEADGGSSAVELPLSAGNAGQQPVTGQWATYTFSIQSLSDAGLDISAIDVLMVFPAWGTGEGAVYRLDNVLIYNPNAANTGSLTLFRDAVNADWTLWDCCAGSTPQVVDAGAPYGNVAQFSVLGSPETVQGFLAKEGVSFDASPLLANGALSFDMRVVDAPANPDSTWLFKIESSGAGSAVELPLAAGNNGQAPVTGQWARYSFSLQSLFDAGLDISDISVIMVFPAWGTGTGAVYQIDNAEISNN
ncbi:glycoside hydrolase family 16 protein [Arsukibacterium ikkense]|nr:glycoside hydrolase family 16 protein [Arsukibacterium ikkense]